MDKVPRVQPHVWHLEPNKVCALISVFLFIRLFYFRTIRVYSLFFSFCFFFLARVIRCILQLSFTLACCVYCIRLIVCFCAFCVDSTNFVCGSLLSGTQACCVLQHKGRRVSRHLGHSVQEFCSDPHSAGHRRVHSVRQHRLERPVRLRRRQGRFMDHLHHCHRHPPAPHP